MPSRLSLLMVRTCVQLRGEAGVDPWVEAAKRVAANSAIRDSLFKHYVALVDLATNYNTQDRSNSWRKDQSYIGAQVVGLNYDLPVGDDCCATMQTTLFEIKVAILPTFGDHLTCKTAVPAERARHHTLQ